MGSCASVITFAEVFSSPHWRANLGFVRVTEVLYRAESRAQLEAAQVPAGTRRRAIAAGEALRAAASDDGQKAPLGALGVKSESGPPMTLGSAVAAKSRPSSDARLASIRSSPIPSRCPCVLGARLI